jgi:hypothetical protein
MRMVRLLYLPRVVLALHQVLDQTANWMEVFSDDACAYGIDRGLEAFYGACG